MKIRYLNMHSLPIISLVLVLLVGAGCASSPQGVEREGPVEIRGIDVRPAVPGAVLEVLADGPLSWTAISDLNGSLILEFDNSATLAGLDDLVMESGLVESVKIEAVEGFHPGTRLVVKTRQRIDFSPNILGSSFEMRLLPQGRSHRGDLAVEPLLVDEFGHSVDSPTEVSELVANEGLAADHNTSEGGDGSIVPAREAPPADQTQDEIVGQDSEEKRFSPRDAIEVTSPAKPARANNLLDVRIEASGTIVLDADGELVYQTFWLENPIRFVIDLPGVVMGMPSVDLPGGRFPLQRVRVGQFKTEPDPVARVVLDLTGPIRTEIEVTGGGLRVQLHEVGTTEIQE